VSASTAVGLCVLWPLLGAVAVVLLGRRPNLREAASLVCAGSLFALVVGWVLPAVRAGERPALTLLEVLPGLPLAFEVEPLGMLFALLASGLWIVTGVYAIGYMRGHHEKRQTRFYACFALAIAGALGVAFAANLFTLFLFYEFITLSTYPLVTHHGTEKAKLGGRTYLGVLMSTSVAFLLLALVWTYHLAGTTDFRAGGILAGKAGEGLLAVLLALFVFGTAKAALMPFHRWLPAAMVAPTPVSALLHAVAVVKAGVFTVVKIGVYVFGLDTLKEMSGQLLGSGWLVYAACFTILAASLVALFQDNLKRRLAYSTVSQLAYIVLGLALFNPMAVQGAALHMVMHAAGKITLFFCAGAILVATHKTEISQMRGIGRRMPFTMFAFLLGSLSIIGLPPCGGMWSKWFLFLGALEAERLVAVGVLVVSSLLNIAYLLPIAINAFFAPPDDEEEARGGIREAPAACVVPLTLTALAGPVLFLFPDFFIDLARRIGAA